MDQDPLDPDRIQRITDEMLLAFAERPHRSLDVSEGGVSVSIDTRFQIRGVNLEGFKLSAKEASRLEQAIVAAVNAAIKLAMESNAKRLEKALSPSKGK